MRRTELAGTILDYRHLRGETLHGWLSRVIAALADPAVAAALADEVGDTWRIELCPDAPASATVSWRDKDGAIHSERFAPEQGTLPLDTRNYAAPDGARRVVVLPFSVLLAAGQLYGDTLAHTTAPQSSSTKASGSAAADEPKSKTTKAARSGNRSGLQKLGQPATAGVSRIGHRNLTSIDLSTTDREAMQADLPLSLGDRRDDRRRANCGHGITA